MKKTIISLIIIILVVLGIVLLVNNKEGGETEATIDMEKLSVVILAEGQGDPIQVGQTAVVHYTGTLIDGVVFDSSLTRGTPLEFRYGVGSVIAGWEKGLENMKVGEKRRLVIPPEFGYGDTQVGSIPAGSTLIFDVELLEIK
jgi:peptidylprolyl isomerase